MTPVTLEYRLQLGRTLREDREDLSRRLTEEWFTDHPEFERSHPPAARQRTREDFGYLIDFLAGAIEADSNAAFADMIAWTARVLEARSVPRTVLEDSLLRIETALGSRLADAQLGLARSVLAHGRTTLSSSDTTQSASELGPATNVYLQAVLHGDRRAALVVADEALQQGATIADVYLEILQAALYEVGRRWESNEITVADEHLATAITQWVVAQLYERLDIPATHRGRVIITGIEGEFHQVGANMVADVLESDGWNVRFLGSNVPHAAVLASVDEHRADVLGISATMLAHLSRVEALVSDARQRFGADLRIVVGGSAFRFNPGMALEIGADAHALDLKSAMTVLRDIA